MSGKSKGGKAKVEISKPEPPPFLQRIREQIVANEDVERREQAERKRKLRPSRPGDPDDGPTIVQLNDRDLTEDEYKRMKLEMETQYKLDSDKETKHEELDVDALIQSRLNTKDDLKSARTNRSGSNNKSKSVPPTTKSNPQKSDKKDATVGNAKKLSYGSSSEEED